MPKPTLQNRRYFKDFLKRYRDKFTSGIQTCQVGDISAMFSQSAAGLSTTADVNLLLISGQQYDDNINIDSISDGSLIYFPANSGDYVNVGLNSLRYQLYFPSEDGGITFDGTTYGLNETFDIGTKSFTVKALGGALVESNDGPTYSLSILNTSGISTNLVYEGDSINFVLNTENVSDGTTLYYTTVGVATAADFSDNSLTGSFNVVGTGATTGIATVVRTILRDSLTEYVYEDFEIRIRTSSITGSIVAESGLITIRNSAPPPPPTYSVTSSATSVNEGESVNIIISTTDVNNGTTLYFNSTTSMTASDFSDNSLTGSVNVVSTGATTGIATITRTIANDLLSEGQETFFLSIRTDSITGTVVGTSSTITVNNVEPSYSLSPSATTVNEGDTVTMTVSGSNIPNGTYYWTIEQQSGALTASDFSGSSLNGTVSIISNSGSFNLSIIADRITETEETFLVNLRKDSITGDVVASSSIVVVNDTSRNVGENANGLTFGPVQVNRDNGVAANASDWYAICDLDTIPDGSSIALFIDTSGSMTQETIQASYDLLLEKLNERNITITSVTNSNEDWITPFLVDLP